MCNYEQSIFEVKLNSFRAILLYTIAWYILLAFNLAEWYLFYLTGVLGVSFSKTQEIIDASTRPSSVGQEMVSS